MSDIRKVLVVKFGSTSVSGSVGIDISKIGLYCSKLVELMDRYAVVVVSSGSIAEGRKILSGYPDINSDKLDNSVVASLGSAGSSYAWQKAFGAHGILAGQLLATHRELDDTEEGNDLASFVQKSLDSGVVPICNENDPLSQIELKKLSYGGDNDGLAAHLAVRLKADKLLLLSDIDGFLVDGEVQRVVNTESIKDLTPHMWEANQKGTGSMESKLNSGALAVAGGVKVHIANASADYGAVLAGKEGTKVVLYP